MTTTTETGVSTQVYRVWIKASPEKVWDAITQRDWVDRYGYGGFLEVKGGLKPGSSYRIEAGTGMQAAGFTGDVIDGEIVEADPPRKLVQTWRMLMDPELAAEGFTRLTWEIDALDGGVTRLTVSHDLEGAPRIAAMVSGALEGEGAGGGWAWILSDLKTLLESGKPLTG